MKVFQTKNYLNVFKKKSYVLWLIIVVGQGTGGGLEKEGKVREWEARLWGLKS